MRAIRRLRHSRQLIEDTFQEPGKQQASSPRRPIAQSKSRKLWISHTIDDRHNAENCVYSLQHKLTTHFLRVYLKHRLAPGCREKVHSQRADIGREFSDLTCPPAYCTHQWWWWWWCNLATPPDALAATSNTTTSLLHPPLSLERELP